MPEEKFGPMAVLRLADRDSFIESLVEHFYSAIEENLPPGFRQEARQDEELAELVGRCVGDAVAAFAGGVPAQAPSEPDEPEWEEFKRRYPNWRGDEQEIRAEFEAARSRHGAKKIFVSLDIWLASIEWQKDEGRYIHWPANWFGKNLWLQRPRRSNKPPIVSDLERERLAAVDREKQENLLDEKAALYRAEAARLKAAGRSLSDHLEKSLREFDERDARRAANASGRCPTSGEISEGRREAARQIQASPSHVLDVLRRIGQEEQPSTE